MKNNKRVVPVILLINGGAFITRRFKKPVYVGDPVNIVRLFSEKVADEILIVCKNGWKVEKSVLKSLARFARVPLSVCGKVRKIEDVQELLSFGVEKIVLGSSVEFYDAARIIEHFGISTVSYKIDITHTGLFKKRQNYNGHDSLGQDKMLENFFNEIILTFIDQDGTFEVNLSDEVIRFLSTRGSLGYCGGIGSLDDLPRLFDMGYSGLYSGSFFSTSKGGGILINYLSEEFKIELYGEL